MVMTDLCDPYGDSALRDGGFQTLYPEPKSYFLRFSDKPANGFLLDNLTSRFRMDGWSFFDPLVRQ